MKLLARLSLCICTTLSVCGCASHRTVIELDARHPSIRQTANGTMVGDVVIKPEELPEYLSDFDVPHDRTIHILLDDDVRDLRPARFLMALLAKAGYTRPVLVTKRHAEATIIGKRKKPKNAPPQPPPRKIRYKRNQR